MVTAPTRKATTMCDILGCNGEIHECHGGEIYLCEKHWNDLLIVVGYGIEPDDWWDGLVAVGMAPSPLDTASR